jgi:hypothetical protein
MKRLALALALTAVALVTTSARAAGPSGPPTSCVKSSDGSGVCAGSFYGIHHTNDPTDYVRFSSMGLFSASISGVHYACSVTSANVQQMWPTMLLSHGRFEIHWDSTGSCVFVSAANDSDVPWTF